MQAFFIYECTLSSTLKNEEVFIIASFGGGELVNISNLCYSSFLLLKAKFGGSDGITVSECLTAWLPDCNQKFLGSLNSNSLMTAYHNNVLYNALCNKPWFSFNLLDFHQTLSNNVHHDWLFPHQCTLKSF